MDGLVWCVDSSVMAGGLFCGCLWSVFTLIDHSLSKQFELFRRGEEYDNCNI